MRLMGVIGCTLWMSSCKQAPEAQTSANYAIMKVTTADKELSTSYGKNGADCYSKNGHAVTVLTRQS